MAAEWNVIVQYVRLWGQFQFETTRMGSFRVCSSTKTRTWLKTKKPQKSIRTCQLQEINIVRMSCTIITPTK
ncbi:hypothetical protein MTP99_011558 [Tenebrio molitor]|nr:hypothetical protein MTP99_011558 [Tenebrio molitor]CAH1370047.1 unnamed protein product [Tenebrio molitor]